MVDVKGNSPLECYCREQWAESAYAPPSGTLSGRRCLPPALSEVRLSAPKPPAPRPHWAANVLAREAYPQEKPLESSYWPNSSSPLCFRCLYCCDGLGGPWKIMRKGRTSLKERLRDRDTDTWASELWRGAEGKARFSGAGLLFPLLEPPKLALNGKGSLLRLRRRQVDVNLLLLLCLLGIPGFPCGQFEIHERVNLTSSPLSRPQVQGLEPALCCTVSPQPFLGLKRPRQLC